MAHIDFSLAMLGASPACQREVARRMRGNVLEIDGAGPQPQGWLSEVHVVAMLGSEVDWPLLKQCMQARKYVVIDAAACRSRAAVDRLFEHAGECRGGLFIANPLASLPSRQTIQQQHECGVLGETGLVRIHRWSAPADGLQSSLLLYELDCALRYFGAGPQRVFASEYAEGRGCAVHLNWASGPMAMIDFVVQPMQHASYASFSVIGSRGSAYADDHPNVQLLVGQRATGLTVPETADWQAHMLLTFFARLRALAAMPPGSMSEAARPALEGWSRCSLLGWGRSLQIAESVFESLRTRRVVEPNYACEPRTLESNTVESKPHESSRLESNTLVSNDRAEPNDGLGR